MERRDELGVFQKNARSATTRLKKYYSQLGFVPVPGTDLMIRNLYAEHVPLAFDEAD